jgi:hypothetical protein
MHAISFLTLLLILLTFPRLLPLLLQRPHTLNALLISFALFPLRPVLEQSHSPLLLANFTHALEKVPDVLFAAVAHFQA